MGLDRDELAARFAVADYGADTPSGGRGAVASNAVDMADALLAALASKPAEVATPCCHTEAHPGRTCAEYNAAPPVASSGAGSGYVPAVGDIVRWDTQENRDEVWCVISEGTARSLTITPDRPRDSEMSGDRAQFVRKATASERAAAGLNPEPTPAVAARIIAEQRAAGLPPAPAPVAERPTHVRITGPSNAARVTVGKVYAVIDWDEDCDRAVIRNDEGERWLLARMKADSGDRTFPAYEPCPPPPPADARGDEEAAAHKYADEQFGECASATERRWFVSGWLAHARDSRKDEGGAS